MFLQWLSLRLGIASGLDLAQACRERFPARVSRLLWLTCEIAITACDLAEVIGAAIALKLLFGIPMLVGVGLTALDTLLILLLQQRGMRYIEAFVVALMAVIGACFAYGAVPPPPGARSARRVLRPGSGDAARSLRPLHLAGDIRGDGHAPQPVSAQRGVQGQERRPVDAWQEDGPCAFRPSTAWRP